MLLPAIKAQKVASENKKTEIREYPFGDLFAQSVGYSTKGKTGIEALANFYLMESNSNPVVQVANERHCNTL